MEDIYYLVGIVVGKGGVMEGWNTRNGRNGGNKKTGTKCTNSKILKMVQMVRILHLKMKK